MRMLRMALVLCAGMAPAPALAAETWPSRPVKLVVPFSAAGTADLLARLIADRLGPALGQPVVVEHRPGADGIVGQEQVARASPDGYTLVVSSLGSFIISPVFTPVPFDPFRYFIHIVYLGGQPGALFANKYLPFGTLSELVTYAKSRPGAVTCATISIGSQTQLPNEQFQTQAGIKMTHVPYRGAGQIVTDVLGGHIATGITALAAVGGQVSSGAVRGLAIASKKGAAGLSGSADLCGAGLCGTDRLDLVCAVGASEYAARDR